MPQICRFTAQQYLERHNSSSPRRLARFCTVTAGLGRALAISGHVTHSLPGPISTVRLAKSARGTQFSTPAAPPAWRRALPTLRGRLATLRQIELTDAPALLETMTAADVARFISTPPPGLEGFQRFIERMRQEQENGAYACFAVVPTGATRPAGLFQIHAIEAGFENAEWGFALAPAYWGTGLFVEAATLAATFTFETLGASRLEARAALGNGRGNGALKKLGAVQEAILRRAFLCHGEYLDLALWSILASEWRRGRAARRVGVH
jgi:RimJ/RimL family protein N-acetyltransferase